MEALDALGEFGMATCALDPGPSYLVKTSGEIKVPLRAEAVSAAYEEVKVPIALKQACVQSLLKNSILSLTIQPIIDQYLIFRIQ